MNDLFAYSTLVDKYEALRDKRLEADRAAAKLRSEENTLKEELIHAMQSNGASAIGGTHIVVNLKSKEKPVVSDWAKFYSYIAEHDAFDLLQRRVGEKAMQLRWEDGVSVPGVDSFTHYNLTIGKAK